MISKTHTIVVAFNGKYYKICKIIYGKDRSIFITSPYHPSKKAIIIQAKINDADAKTYIKIENAVDVAFFDDDEKRLKLTHHTSGFIQFSGEGIISGIDKNTGKIKGIGINSWPLENPVKDPFSLTIYGFEHFKQVDKIESDFHVLSVQSYQRTRDFNALIMLGYCFPSDFRRFVTQREDGHPIINTLHPTGIVSQLLIAFPPLSCPCQTFIGLEMYFIRGIKNHRTPSFFMSSSSGKMEFNDKNEKFHEFIFCMYPRQEIGVRRSLNFELKSPDIQ